MVDVIQTTLEAVQVSIDLSFSCLYLSLLALFLLQTFPQDMHDVPVTYYQIQF